MEWSATDGEEADYSSGDHQFRNPTRALQITGAGNLVVRMLESDADITLVVTASVLWPMRVTHVRQTSTVATVVGLW